MSQESEPTFKADAYDRDFYLSMLELGYDYYFLIAKRGACVDQNLASVFYNMSTSKKAIEICRDCPVRRECLHYALINNETACVYGGFDEFYRRKVLDIIRASLRAKHPGFGFVDNAIQNPYIWNTIVEKFDEVSLLPYKLNIRHGTIRNIKKKERNLLVP